MKGFKKLLLYVKNRYNSPNIYITENGFSCPGEADLTVADAIHDSPRVDYFQGYLKAMLEAVAEGVHVKAYMAWSLVLYL